MKNSIIEIIKKYQTIIFVILATLIISALFIILIIFVKKSTTQTPSQVTKQEQPSPTLQPPKDYSIEIGTQNPGITLVVDRVSMVNRGWLVIHQDQNGQVGPLLQEVIPPAEVGILERSIFFLRDPLISGQKYFMMIHTDDGDSKFEYPGPDEQALNSKGEVVMQPFSVK